MLNKRQRNSIDCCIHAAYTWQHLYRPCIALAVGISYNGLSVARFYYSSLISSFLEEPSDQILGKLALHHEFQLEAQQRNAWSSQIDMLKKWLFDTTGTIIFEYTIPRMGKRIDCVILSGSAVYAIEFKVGAKSFDNGARTQVMDYALDLKNFHAASHDAPIIPILVCTNAPPQAFDLEFHEDKVGRVILTNGQNLAKIIRTVQCSVPGMQINAQDWTDATYKPTPTIIEAAQALYRGHSVQEISRSDAGAVNLSHTAKTISAIIDDAKATHKKAICFLTGVPGAGKTLAGLNLANSWHDTENNEHAVFLSGNGPLVKVLREALARNKVENSEKGTTKSDAHRDVAGFIQNIHHFRDDALNDLRPPHEHVVIFDEAQRAWTHKKTADFMRQKKGKPDFDQSEPEFLISVMDRHLDWAVIICLIGGGQEINTGEAGIQEWFQALGKSFPDWNIHVSNKLADHEYTQGQDLYGLLPSDHLFFHDTLHLSVSIRSYRSEKVAAFVKAVLDCDISAKSLLDEASKSYPICLTRDINKAKAWLRSKQRGSERMGIVASSGAIRLKPFAIHVKNEIDPTNWFLNEADDIRSSNFLEDVATEYDVQGLESDWTCVAWDADLRFNGHEWEYKAFRGKAWQAIRDDEAKKYLKNSYRVLLTRARQGMVIFVPHGNAEDHTRPPVYYDDTYEYLRSLGIKEL